MPASYGGFETFVENLGQRLARRGHEVTVYCRPHACSYCSTYRGMHCVYLPTIATKHLDTIIHTFVCTLHMAFRRRPDVALYVVAGNSPLAALSRAFGIPSIINVDGLDSRRVKWGRRARAYLRWTERNAPRCATATVTDSRSVQSVYREEYGAETHYIPYGADMDGVDTGEYLRRYGLEPRQYILFVGRLVAENNAHVLVQAFEGLKTDLKLVVVGGAPYADDYQKSLKETDDERIVFTGYLYGDGYRELTRNAAIFVEPTEVGGTHPAIVEAMAAGNCVVVSDFPPNLETIGDAGASYPRSERANGLRRVLAELLEDPVRVQRCREAAKARAREQYSWDAVTDAYEKLATSVVAQRPRRHRPFGWL